MSTRNRKLLSVLEFILHEASADDLDSVIRALDKRMQKNPPPRRTASPDDVSAMVDENIGDLKSHFTMPENMHAITQNLVSGLIRTHAPQISDEELHVLLQRWAPSSSKLGEGRESELPADLIFSMVGQFVAYATNRISEEDLAEIRLAMPDWTERYWQTFSVRTREMIRDHLRGKLDEQTFGMLLQKHLMPDGG